MKSFFAIVASSIFAAAASASFLQDRATRSCADPTIAVPFYRLWNNQLSAHLMTTSESERSSALGSGWYDDGVAAYIWTDKEPSTVALYRLKRSDSTDWFYTTSASEKNQYIKTRGYIEEGIAGYIYPSALCGGKSFFRTYKSSTTDHYYTDSSSRRDEMGQWGWDDEGVVGFSRPPSC